MEKVLNNLYIYHNSDFDYGLPEVFLGFEKLFSKFKI